MKKIKLEKLSVFGSRVGDCLKREDTDVITDMARRVGNELPTFTTSDSVLDSVKELVKARDAEGCCDEYKQFLREFLTICDGVHADVVAYDDPAQKIMAAYMISTRDKKGMIVSDEGLTPRDRHMIKHLFMPKSNGCCCIQ